MLDPGKSIKDKLCNCIVTQIIVEFKFVLHYYFAFHISLTGKPGITAFIVWKFKVCRPKKTLVIASDGLVGVPQIPTHVVPDWAYLHTMIWPLQYKQVNARRILPHLMKCLWSCFMGYEREDVFYSEKRFFESSAFCAVARWSLAIAMILISRIQSWRAAWMLVKIFLRKPKSRIYTRNLLISLIRCTISSQVKRLEKEVNQKEGSGVDFSRNTFFLQEFPTFHALWLLLMRLQKILMAIPKVLSYSIFARHGFALVFATWKLGSAQKPQTSFFEIWLQI